MDKTIYIYKLFSLFLSISAVTEMPQAQTDTTSDYHAQVYRYMMNNTNKQTRPTSDPSQPTNIYVGFLLARISTLDEKQEIMKTFGVISSSWFNPQCRWDPSNFGGVKTITIPGSDVWLPEVVLLNGVEDENDLALASKFRVQISHDGWTSWSPSFRWVTTCKLDLWRFPFDKQTCSVMFVNWVHGKNSQIFTNMLSTVSTELVEDNGAWLLESTNTGTYDLKLSHFPDERYPIIYFRVQMKRRPEFYIWNIIIPVAIISLMSSMVFLLPAESGEKVSLQITVLLGYTVIMLMLSDILPRSSLNMPLLILFNVLSMAGTAVSMICTIIVVKLFHMMPSREVPGWIRVICLRGLATVLCVGGCCKSHAREHKHHGHGAAEKMSEFVDSLRQMQVHIPDHIDDTISRVWHEERKADHAKRNMEEWRMLSRVLDRFFMFIFLFGFVAFLTTFLYMLTSR